MANIIKIKGKSTTGAPSAASLSARELCVVEPDNKLFVKKTDGSVVELGAGGGGGSISSYQGSLSADVQLMITGTWYNGASVSLPAGTYLVCSHTTFMRNATTATTYYNRITDGSNHHASGQAYQPSASGHSIVIALNAIVTLEGTTTIKIQSTASAGAPTCLMKAATGAIGQGSYSGNNATQITAIRLS